MATASAKSGKKSTSASKSTKKKTAAASSKKHEEQSSGGLGLETILDVVGQLAGGGSGNSGSSKKKKKADENPLTSILTSFLGGGDSGKNGGSVDYAAIIELVLPLLLSNSKHAESFKSNPSKTIKQLTGVNVGEQHLGPIVEELLGKLNSK